jgi:hypothetical protein
MNNNEPTYLGWHSFLALVLEQLATTVSKQEGP